MVIFIFVIVQYENKIVIYLDSNSAFNPKETVFITSFEKKNVFTTFSIIGMLFGPEPT